MSYKIKNQYDEVTTITEVEYIFKDGTVKEFRIPHFKPKDEAEIVKGIENREISEQRAIDEEKEVKPLEDNK